MNPTRILRPATAAALVLAPLGFLPPPLAAQAAGAAWHEVMRGDDGSTVSVELASIRRTGGSSFTARTAVRYPQPVQLEGGAPIDRKVDLEELDCGSARIRGIESELLRDAAVVRRVRLSREWMPVGEDRRPLFDARCGFLLGSFASLPVGYELSGVDRQPELANRAEVAAALSRFYPEALRDAGITGRVNVRFRVLEDGSVDVSSLVATGSPEPGFSAAALEVVKRMRFRPARVGEKAVAVWIDVPVTFQLQ
ncbi:MAG: energy transducer TonB [Longimicrobiaceae bacterium]